ncbi:solute carrier family 2, facilitated glucose transporter member 11-like isoform X1 [Pantherophis guttatus]|uniref:Solute carrier family 2, facilitated glucose transporter member 5 n=2 Tax=Pantherophis guttatus TaxID=94885 RepID=A0A6P9DG62_PANGU|nr:solute carrier family 2, facilitated glucose transporter member 11-like isoform X1 [Pantherophis guttatus]
MALIFWDVIQYQRLLLMVVILGIGGSLQVGFQGSMITYASMHIKEFINETWLERFGHSVRPSTLTLLWSSVVSIFGLGGLLGSMSSGCLAAKYGKKKCFWGSSVLMVASAFLLGFSKMARSVELILVGRFLCGISTGVCILLHPQYLGEVSPKKLRGFTTSTASMFWCLGKVLGQVMGLRELLGSGALWPMLLAFSGTAALVPLLTLPFFPESPPYLLLHKGDEEGCVKAMKTFWGEEPHRAELDDLRKEQAALNIAQSKSFLEVVKEPSLRWQLYMLLVLAVTTQLSGIQAIYSYTFEVLQTAGFHLEQIPYLALGVSLCEFFSTVLCSFIIERFGRKVLLWAGYALMGTMLAGITLALSLQPWFSWMPYCCLSLIFCFVFVFGMGPAGATVSLRMEIFDQSSRAPAFAISGTLSWVGVFVIGMVFPLMMENFRQFSFLIFMGSLYTSGFIIYFFLPETKKKSILEIREEFDKLNFKKKQIPVLEAKLTKDHELCTKL